MKITGSCWSKSWPCCIPPAAPAWSCWSGTPGAAGRKPGGFWRTCPPSPERCGRPRSPFCPSWSTPTPPRCWKTRRTPWSGLAPPSAPATQSVRPSIWNFSCSPICGSCGRRSTTGARSTRTRSGWTAITGRNLPGTTRIIIPAAAIPPSTGPRLWWWPITTWR